MEDKMVRFNPLNNIIIQVALHHRDNNYYYTE